MAFHYWNGSAWKIVNNSYEFPYDEVNAYFRIWNGSSWGYATNAKVWNGSTWKGFVDKVQLSDDNAVTANFGPGAEASWVIYTSGNVEYSEYATSPSFYPWIANPANSNQYQIRVQQVGGEALEGTSDPLDTWLDLSTTRVWRVFANEFNSSVQAFLYGEIRHKITLEIVATNSFSIYATTTGEPVPI
jgi:hypothetical protein